MQRGALNRMTRTSDWWILRIEEKLTDTKATATGTTANKSIWAFGGSTGRVESRRRNLKRCRPVEVAPLFVSSAAGIPRRSTLLAGTTTNLARRVILAHHTPHSLDRHTMERWPQRRRTLLAQHGFTLGAATYMVFSGVPQRDDFLPPTMPSPVPPREKYGDLPPRTYWRAPRRSRYAPPNHSAAPRSPENPPTLNAAAPEDAIDAPTPEKPPSGRTGPARGGTAPGPLPAVFSFSLTFLREARPRDEF